MAWNSFMGWLHRAALGCARLRLTAHMASDYFKVKKRHDVRGGAAGTEHAARVTSIHLHWRAPDVHLASFASCHVSWYVDTSWSALRPADNHNGCGADTGARSEFLPDMACCSQECKVEEEEEKTLPPLVGTSVGARAIHQRPDKHSLQTTETARSSKCLSFLPEYNIKINRKIYNDKNKLSSIWYKKYPAYRSIYTIKKN